MFLLGDVVIFSALWAAWWASWVCLKGLMTSGSLAAWLGHWQAHTGIYTLAHMHTPTHTYPHFIPIKNSLLWSSVSCISRTGSAFFLLLFCSISSYQHIIKNVQMDITRKPIHGHKNALASILYGFIIQKAWLHIKSAKYTNMPEVVWMPKMFLLENVSLISRLYKYTYECTKAKDNRGTGEKLEFKVKSEG